MSQSSNSSTNMNIFSEISTILADDKVMPVEGGKGMKRSASNQPQEQVKKSMMEYHLAKECASNPTSKSSIPPKFINASEMLLNARVNEPVIPELSDDELLKMAIEFEKQHPQ